ncbi:hypothetical protein KRM28CT15_15070 [Krasilnikovia sp. M28-CT-15]
MRALSRAPAISFGGTPHDPHDPLTRGQQGALQPGRHMPAVLDGPHSFLRELSPGPAHQQPVPGVGSP